MIEHKPAMEPVPTEIDIEVKKKRSLRYSITDGSFYSVMVGFGESFFSAYALFLSATASQIALLGSLPQAVGSVSQLFTEKLLLFFQTRKRLVLVSATLQALTHLLLIGAYFLGKLSVPIVIISICLYFLFAMLPGPAWGSWMGDLVSEKQRGSYFGTRNQICGICSFSGLLVAGYLLQQMTDGGMRFAGFALLFGIAMIMRLFSVYYLSKKYEPAIEVAPQQSLSLLTFVRTVLLSNYGLFILFLWCMNFGVFISGPFFAIYMLRDLSFSYVTFTLINVTAIIAKLLFVPIWGKAADMYGTRKLLVLSAILIVPQPILWMFSAEIWYLVLIQVFAGFAWAGFELLAFNFLFDTTERHKRTSYFAFYNAVNGFFLISGALFGSWLITLPLFTVGVFSTFVASSSIRLLAVILFIPKLKEVREVVPVRYRKLLFSILTIEPAVGLVNQITMFADQKRKVMFEDIDTFVSQINLVTVKPTVGFVTTILGVVESARKETFEDIDTMISRFLKKK